MIFILLAAGIFNAAAPRTAWYLEYGWLFKEADPSDTALTINRVGGILAIVIAVIMMIV